MCLDINPSPSTITFLFIDENAQGKIIDWAPTSNPTSPTSPTSGTPKNAASPRPRAAVEGEGPPGLEPAAALQQGGVLREQVGSPTGPARRRSGTMAGNENASRTETKACDTKMMRTTN